MAPPSRRTSAAATPARAEADWVLAGRSLVRGRLQSVEIGISDEGTIVSVGRSVRGHPRHDVGEGVILPSATDLHVHFRDPGGPDDVEDFVSGTRQAALGGVGLVGEMPNTRPLVADRESLDAKEARVRGRAAVDVLLYAAPSIPREIAGLARRAGGFKIYLSPTTNAPDPPEPEQLPSLFRRLERTGLPVAVHAEDPSRFRSDLPPEDPVGWNATRPVEAEWSAVDRVLAAAPVGLRLHFAHLTSPRSVQRVHDAGFSAEVTGHHLLLHDRSGVDAHTKVNPPLRADGERRELWTAFAAGSIPHVASDHAPHSLHAKERPFPVAPSGVPGVETTLPLLLARVRAGDLSLDRLVAAACDRPARWLGQPRGRLAPGHRADLIVVDFRSRTRLAADRLHAPAGWTPFEGREAIFPREHYLEGRRLVHSGEFVGSSQGRIVRPEYAPA